MTVRSVSVERYRGWRLEVEERPENAPWAFEWLLVAGEGARAAAGTSHRDPTSWKTAGEARTAGRQAVDRLEAAGP